MRARFGGVASGAQPAPTRAGRRPQDGVFRACIIPAWCSLEELLAGAVTDAHFPAFRLKNVKLTEAEVGYGAGACSNLGSRLVSSCHSLASS
jgi:hypothetical protein